MNYLKILFAALLCFSFSHSFGQNITYSKSFFDKTGDPGMMITPDVSFYNSHSDTIEVFVNRFYKNLPPNWTSCFCFMQCHMPTEDTLHFFLAPGEKVSIGVGFSTDAIPGVGYVKFTMEQIGGTQKDTLSFSVSTVASGINELVGSKSFNLYPNPSTDKVIFNTTSSETYSIRIVDCDGKLINQQSDINTKQHTLNLESIPTGEYFLNVQYRSGKTETQKIIKN